MDRSARFYGSEEFYRRYGLPQDEREGLIDEFREHKLLVKNLGAEATRAANLVSERVRSEHDPQ